MPYIANTDSQRKAMLQAVGAASVEELFADIPRRFRTHGLNIPAGISEMEALAEMKKLSARNTDLTCFMGGGFYDHFIPSAVDVITSRSEFYTAYTPYQPEASQGTLQAIFEYQSAICRLTGMEVSNASLYDGGTGIFEAVMMAVRLTGRNRIIVDECVNPIYREMLTCYTRGLHLEIITIDRDGVRTAHTEILKNINNQTAAVVTQNPNFFGTADDFSDIAEAVHSAGGLLITSVYPISLGILKSPGNMGADIVTGEGQSLGLPLSFGGPYLGFLATRKKHVRKMPGRLVGLSSDTKGRRAFVLTLQAREQHIRREKAASNICSNEALCALRAVIYLSLMGKDGLVDTAKHCAKKTEYLKSLIGHLPEVEVHDVPVFNEFVIDLPISADEVASRMMDKGFAAGLPLGRYYGNMKDSMLIAVTEKRSAEQIETFARTLEKIL